MPISPSLRGLSRATGTGPSGDMPGSPYTPQAQYTPQAPYEQTTPNLSLFDPTTDPLGIAVQGRARDARQQQQLANPQSMTAGPLANPQWDGFFQALHESSGGEPTTLAGSTGEDLGYDTNNGTMGAGTEIYGPRGIGWNKQPKALR